MTFSLKKYKSHTESLSPKIYFWSVEMSKSLSTFSIRGKLVLKASIIAGTIFELRILRSSSKDVDIKSGRANIKKLATWLLSWIHGSFDEFHHKGCNSFHYRLLNRFTDHFFLKFQLVLNSIIKTNFHAQYRTVEDHISFRG